MALLSLTNTELRVESCYVKVNVSVFECLRCYAALVQIKASPLHEKALTPNIDLLLRRS